MYEFLEGEVAERSPSRVVLAVGGVGYSMSIPLSTYGKVPARGKAKLLTHLHTTDDGPRLFGFATSEERDLFRLLLSVSGVGPQTSLALLSQLSPGELAASVAAEDADRLRQVKGVGEKTAKRILLELKEKMPHLGLEAAATTIHPPAYHDAVAALVSIGYERKDAESAVARAQKKTKSSELEALLRAAIAETGK